MQEIKPPSLAIITGFPARAWENIRAAVARSRIPEDPGHAANTLSWMQTLFPEAGLALRVAAYAHDVERGFDLLRVSQKDFPGYDQYKLAHAQNSARILEIILQNHQVDSGLTQAVVRLVARHEFGGDPESDQLKQADSLSFFDVNLPLFFKRNGWDRTLDRSLWGLKRLVPEFRLRALALNRHRPVLHDLLQTALTHPDLAPSSQ